MSYFVFKYNFLHSEFDSHSPSTRSSLTLKLKLTFHFPVANRTTHDARGIVDGVKVEWEESNFAMYRRLLVKCPFSFHSFAYIIPITHSTKVYPFFFQLKAIAISY